MHQCIRFILLQHINPNRSERKNEEALISYFTSRGAAEELREIGDGRLQGVGGGQPRAEVDLPQSLQVRFAWIVVRRAKGQGVAIVWLYWIQVGCLVGLVVFGLLNRWQPTGGK